VNRAPGSGFCQNELKGLRFEFFALPSASVQNFQFLKHNLKHLSGSFLLIIFIRLKLMRDIYLHKEKKLTYD